MAVITQKITIQNLKGLHARATAAFVKLAETFEADIQIEKDDGLSVSGKSIMGILMLGVPLGEQVTLTASGTDAQAAINALCELVNNRFGED